MIRTPHSVRRSWNALRCPTSTPGRRYSYHRLLYLVAPLLLGVVLRAPLRVVGVIVVAVFLAWWFGDSLHREGQ